MIVLDGAMGTELTRRGADTTLPLWSARALVEMPDLVEQIHRDYIEAGAQVITANTFRTNRRTLQRAGFVEAGMALTHRAIALAQSALAKAGGGRSIKIAGSMATVEDCYSPWLVPDDAMLANEHGEMAQHLAKAGCDLILVETMNTVREAVAATRAAQQTGLPVWTSFTLDEHNTILSGESLATGVRAVLPYHPQAMLVNCIPVAQVAEALVHLRAALQHEGAGHLNFGAYANVGHVDDTVGWTLTHAVTPSTYAENAHAWRALGATILGGCCGTRPDHIAALTSASEIAS